MKNYFRMMLGQGSSYATDCVAGNFVGVDFGIHEDLNGQLPENWRDFNRRFIPIFLASRPEKSKIAAGLACGALWTVAKGMNEGDLLLCPDGHGNYHVGEVIGPYYYSPSQFLQHRRPVTWREQKLNKLDMSEALRNALGAINAVSSLRPHGSEIENLLAGNQSVVTSDAATPSESDDGNKFPLEKHLEDFLVRHWAQTEFGQTYDILMDDGEIVGQQYPTGNGFIDILAVSKDRKTILVVELKRGRASDVVVGQILRYMGYVQEELAEPGQTVRGVIVAFEDDLKLRQALKMVPIVDFYRYSVSFTLTKG
jgi:restriction system protein